MTGSFLLLREESKEKALERLSKDIYATAGAWDMSKATITAVAVAKH
ncbi:BZ3500_MvSof-1268-A1-R1_Chr1-3g02291 [Microbotryum saponariae]|nr:BZ3500_MvSof-1268-A1-R1_Chr1-3g02291 [Microbotryum saponariae]SCZ95892.1 BZ3501_MvSof-1269-A2-R1_Chr1-3g01894 [Microbotryum saponariae]